MDAQQANRMEATLNSILRLLAAQAVEGKPLTEGAKLLERAGLERRMIADLYQTSPESVRSILSKAARARTGSGENKA